MVPSSSPCIVNGLAWACVGQDRDWGIVFIDHRPGERRTIDVVRMVERLVIIMRAKVTQVMLLVLAVGAYSCSRVDHYHGIKCMRQLAIIFPK